MRRCVWPFCVRERDHTGRHRASARQQARCSHDGGRFYLYNLFNGIGATVTCCLRCFVDLPTGPANDEPVLVQEEILAAMVATMLIDDTSMTTSVTRPDVEDEIDDVEVDVDWSAFWAGYDDKPLTIDDETSILDYQAGSLAGFAVEILR